MTPDLDLVARLKKAIEKSRSDNGDYLDLGRPDQILVDSLAEIEALREAVAEKDRALEPFVRHGRAAGALGGDSGPFWIMTEEGHRDVPAEDFRRAARALGAKP